ncbi:MAG: hypothetical protein Q8L47_04635 [bacterium]|nr:hypothetical protein [bacterium]
MKKLAIIILSIITVVVGFLIFYQNRSVEQKTSVITQANQLTNTKRKLASKVDDQASVTVTVTPVDISSKSKEWKFDVVMDTHSVELDQDMAKAVVLIDDQGKEYKSLKWEGPVGGHHREGILIFNQITPTPKSIELKISGIGGIMRSFIWQLN